MWSQREACNAAVVQPWCMQSQSEAGADLHLSDPAVVSELHSDDGYPDQLPDIVELLHATPRLLPHRQQQFEIAALAVRSKPISRAQCERSDTPAAAHLFDTSIERTTVLVWVLDG